MKKLLVYSISLLMFTGILSGCFYDEVAVFEGLPENVSLKNDVMPIFNNNCNSSGCHDAQGSHSPSLVGANAYTSLSEGQFVNTVEPGKSKLYTELNAGMPPSGPLTVNEKKIILAWITEGAKNN